MSDSSTKSLYEQYVLGNYGSPPFALVKGEGARVFDEAGTEYLDFTCGIAVNTLGHCDARLNAALEKQAHTLWHCSNLFHIRPQAELAEALVKALAPGRMFFCNSGTEANEALLKLARLHGRRKAGGEEGRCYKVLTCSNGFHGRTFGGMSATPQEKIQGGFRPMLDGFDHAPLNDLEAFRAKVDENTCAIFIETIQGEGGVHPATGEFLRGLRELCDEHDLLLMLDEVQCGIGRTGEMFAFQHHGVAPDAVGLAKGLGGGFPIGAMWVGEKHKDLFQPGMHGTTFGGNPLACAVALEVIRTLQDGVLDAARALMPGWLEALHGLVEKHPAHLSGVRGQGFMTALVVKGDNLKLIAALRAGGLLGVRAGTDAVRLYPPLNVREDELSRCIEILDTTLRNHPQPQEG